MINLKTYEEADYTHGLSLIGKDTKDTYVISRLAFLMNIDSSKNYINNLHDTEGIWFKFNKEIETSSNFKKYEKIPK